MDPSNAAGPKIAVVFGDPKTGPVGFVIEVPPGGVAPIHSHSASYHAVTLDGAPFHWLPHEKDNGDGFATGTYWMQPGGYNHGDRCNSDTPCHSFVYFDGPLDIKVAEDPKAAK
jgi:quercetin dioxygenase-like cupin family protein